MTVVTAVFTTLGIVLLCLFFIYLSFSQMLKFIARLPGGARIIGLYHDMFMGLWRFLQALVRDAFSR